MNHNRNQTMRISPRDDVGHMANAHAHRQPVEVIRTFGKYSEMRSVAVNAPTRHTAAQSVSPL